MTSTVFAAPDPVTVLSTDLAAAIRAYCARSPRSLQRQIGPSEIGHECLRRVAYSALGCEPSSTGGDPWAAFIGTATHAELAQVFTRDNQRLGRDRWLTEHRVTVRGSIRGTLDLYDTDTATVIDHKIVGPSTHSKVRAGGPSDQYRIQVQLYGYGLANEGRPVERVAIAYYPRSGTLDGRIIHVEPYEPAVAEAALTRMASAIHLAHVLDVDDHPDRWAHIPAEPGPLCTWCPYFDATGRAGVAAGCCPGAT
ncbi:PD-(D/E)XK nuclease family protein [Stackebrandtia soli]|uniref:PD-(D/E)XK nuclease family protein n=1 Tax=Stackebrandtia soli TaxID=1892856 RepID=UPI0039EBE844